MEAIHSKPNEVLEELELFTVNALTHVLLREKHEHDNRCFALPRVPQDPKVALRVSYIAFLAYSSIRSGKLLTKRDIFYMCRLLFPTPESVDRGLIYVSSSLNVNRNELNIVATPKGLVVGKVTYVDEFDNALDVGMFGNSGCLIPPRPERLKNIVADARAVIVVEKEAAFHSLIDESSGGGPLSSYLVVTGKGYPDIGTRQFLRAVALAHDKSRNQMPIYIITDADPHGLSIANCYIQNLHGCKVHWLGVRHSDQSKMFDLQDSQTLRLNQSENTLLDGMLAQWTHDVDILRDPEQSLIDEAKIMKTSQTKFEMEALAANTGLLWNKSGLLDYVVAKVLALERASSKAGPNRSMSPERMERPLKQARGGR